MAEKDCLNNENELNSSIIGSNEVQSQLNIDNLSSELGENSDISSILAIDDINSEMNPDLSTDSNLNEYNQVESELDIPVSIQGEIPEIPTKLSEFENDVGFITLDDIPDYPEKLSEFVNDGDGSSPFATEDFVLQNAGSGGGGGPTVPVVDNLTSQSKTSALSANQGRVLNEKITEVEGNIPTNISELNNDAGFVSKTVSDLENYTTTDKMNEALNNKADRAEIPDISSKADKSELTDYVSKEELQKENFLKEIPSEYITEEELSSAISNKADKSEIPDISGKADKSEIPDISGLATKTEVQSKSEETLKSANDYTDTKVAELIDSAPETLDTFKEIADAFAEDQEVLDTLNSAIGLKADKSDIPDISGKADKSELNDYVQKSSVNSSNITKPFDKIPFINSAGVMEVGTYVDFHSDNTTGNDYSTRLYSNGENKNAVKLPSGSGTLALTTDNVSSATKATQDGDGNVIKDTYLPLAGGTLTGGLTVKNGALVVENAIRRRNTAVEYNKEGSSKVFIGFADKNSTDYAVIDCQKSGGDTSLIVNPRSTNGTWASTNGTLSVSIDASGKVTTKAVTPESTADDRQIATTAWVKDRTDTFLPLTGGTLTGNLTIADGKKLINLGNAAGNSIITRGIQGSDGAGGDGDLHLQNGKDFVTKFGKSSVSTLNADGGISLNGAYPQIKTNQPDFVIQTSGGQQYDFTNTEFRPTQSYVDTLSIGRSDRKFKNGYFSSIVYAKSPELNSNAEELATTSWVRDSVDITGQTVDIVNLVKGLINTSNVTKSAKYARWYCRINGTAKTDTAAATGSYTVSNIPVNVAFVCEAICCRLSTTSDYGYQLRFVASGTHIIYRTYVTQSSTSLTWYQDVMTVGNQTIAGNKTFSGTVSANSLTGNAVYNRASVDALTAASTWANNSRVPTLTTLAYWDGRFQKTSNSSNLKYASGSLPAITDNSNRIATTAWIRKVDPMANTDTNNNGTTEDSEAVVKTNQHDVVVEYWMASDKLSWYRLWASGWLEQGVWITGSTSTEKNIVLPKAYGNTDYNIETSIYYKSENAPSGSGSPTFNTVYNLLPMLFNQRKDGFKTNRYGSNNIYYSFYCCGVITT